MKSKSFAFAALRIISVWVFVEYVIVNFFTTLLRFIEHNSYKNFSFSFLRYPFFNPVLLIIICSIISWFLWFKADALSNLLITTETNENNIESFSSEKILSVALIILGFYFIFDSAPELVQNVVSAVSHNSLTTDYEKGRKLINIIQPALTMSIGMFCVLKAARIKSVVKKWI
jgi:ABC-type multidrug transport system fused ATPase/permease subunit